MKGHGQKFGAKQHSAILALLHGHSLEEAAGQIGVSPSTLSRWMKREDFQRGYQLARRQIYEVGLSRVQTLVIEAIETLKRNLTCPRPMAQIRAASAILDHARYAAEFLNVSDRLTVLENFMQEKKS